MVKAYKVLVIVGDGMADRPVAELGGKTPLSAAKKPNIDGLAPKSMMGLVDPLSPGLRVESDVANMALMGYDPLKYYSGRGAFEALGLGVDLMEGDVAFRANLATVEGGVVVDRRAGRFDWDKTEIVEALNGIDLGDVEVKFYPGVEHRGAVVFRGEGLSRMVSDTDPHETGVPMLEPKPLDNSEEARRTADLLKRFTVEAIKVLERLPVNRRRREAGLPPANAVLCRGAGTLPKAPTFRERFGASFAVVAGIPLVKGVARALDATAPDVPGATGSVDTDVFAKARVAADLLKSHDVVLVHVKGTDTASHDGKVSLKVEMIEKIDAMLGEVLRRCRNDLVIAVTADHATPISVGYHTGDAVPIMVAGPEVMPDGIRSFDEVGAARGRLHKIRACDIVPVLLDVSNRAGLFTP